MSIPTSTRQWILQNKPTDLPVLSSPDPTFELVTIQLPPLADNEVLVKTLYLSNDPAQRGWISKDVDPDRLYVKPVDQGACMRARGICEVIDSKASKLPKGTVITGSPGWAEHAILRATSCNPIEEVPGLAMTHFLGALGLTGLTAYYGIKEIARAGPEDSIVVSGAAGATGSMVVQIAKKMLGCKRVIGMAGSDEKCRWVESLGADACLNYKNETFKDDLIKATEGYVEVYFDNVGGEILDLMLQRMAKHGRVAVCGGISNYNQSVPYGVKNIFEVISMRLEIKGFIFFDFVRQGKGPAAVQELVDAFQAGKITLGDQNETVVGSDIEHVPETWMKLFEGGNSGKLITKLEGGESLAQK
ncbi:hypothetical protein MMC07_006342 [Pseudocyphellaria aurata]|nr:hypothetical protein [Pseudocyphellaria aurata]